MAQTAVTSFYSTRKRFKEPIKSVQNFEKEKLSETFVIDKVESTAIVDTPAQKVSKSRGKKVIDYLKSQPESLKNETKKDFKSRKFPENTPETSSATFLPKQKATKKTRGKKVNKVTNYLKPQAEIGDNKDNVVLNTEKPVETLNEPKVASTSYPPKTKSVNKASSKNVNKVTNYLKPQLETKKSEDEVLQTKETEAHHIPERNLQGKDSQEAQSELLSTPKKNLSKDEVNQETQSKLTSTPKRDLSKDEAFQDKLEAPRTPKRNLSSPDELTPSKKKTLQETTSKSPDKLNKMVLTPKKIEPTARRTLHLNSPNRIVSPRKIASPVKNQVSPQKAAIYGNMSNKDLTSLLQDSRNKSLFSGKLDELKKSLSKFSKASAKTKEFQANSFKITSVIGSAKANNSEPKVFQGEPSYKKYSYLAAPDSHSLVLPYKYKLLSETFRCLDTVVSMLNNRKEKITFEKVQNGVQKMMSKNFLKSHLGKIMTILPEAYSLTYERNNSYSKNTSPYELIINPNLSDSDGNSTLTDRPKKSTQSSFIHMTPQILLERKNIFNHNLTNIVKKHHTIFLKKVKFPIVADNAIVRWHPQFNVDGIPDVPVAVLPEEPETKISTAKDVLNKIRGSVRGRVEKALQSVVDDHKDDAEEKSEPSLESKNSSSDKKTSSALKGICTDLLEKIRARESRKLIENMTRSVHEEKRAAMLERLPKIVHILWHYFIAERKAAVPVDSAVDKIIHSFNSLTTPEEVKEHLQLITETMPGWLTFIKIPKGEFITMDKKKDINEMISNIK